MHVYITYIEITRRGQHQHNLKTTWRLLILSQHSFPSGRFKSPHGVYGFYCHWLLFHGNTEGADIKSIFSPGLCTNTPSVQRSHQLSTSAGTVANKVFTPRKHKQIDTHCRGDDNPPPRSSPLSSFIYYRNLIPCFLPCHPTGEHGPWPNAIF